MTLLVFSGVKCKQMIPAARPDQEDNLITSGCLVAPVTFRVHTLKSAHVWTRMEQRSVTFFLYLQTCVVVGPCFLLPLAARGIGAINKHNAQNENLYLYNGGLSVPFISPNVVRMVRSCWQWVACVRVMDKNQFKYNFYKETSAKPPSGSSGRPPSVPLIRIYKHEH
jgi:hypothetical protein